MGEGSPPRPTGWGLAGLKPGSGALSQGQLCVAAQGGHLPWHAVWVAVLSLHGHLGLRLLGGGCGSGVRRHLPCKVASFFSPSRLRCQ